MTDYLKMKALEMLVVLDLQYFAGDDNPDGGKDPTPPQQQEQPEDEKPDALTFTQEEFNNKIAKEKKTAQENLLKSIGFEDFKNAKDGIEKFKEWQQSQRTDAENKAIELENANKTLEQVNAEKATLAAQLAALKAGANAESLEDVILLAQAKVSDEVTIEDAIAQTLEKYPQFKAQQEQEEEKPPAPQFTPGSPTPPGSGNMTREQFVKMNYEDRVKFQKENPTVFKTLFG